MERLKAEAIELRFGARRYDEVKDELPALRAKAERHDRLLAELKAIRTRAAVALILLEQWLLLYLLVSRERRPAGAMPASSRACRVCILSSQDLRHDMRVPSMVQALVAAGCTVTVVCGHPPAQPLEKGASAAEFLTAAPCPKPEPTRRTARGRRVTGDRAPVTAPGESGAAPFSPPRLVSVGRCLLSTPAVLLLRLARRRLAAARGRHSARVAPAAPVTLPSHRWVQAHAFAEHADMATHDRRFDVVQAHGVQALVAGARLAARDHAKLLCDAVAQPAGPPADHLGSFEMLCRWCENREETAILRGAAMVIASGGEPADRHAVEYGIDRPLVIRDCPHYWPYRIDRRLRADCALGASARLAVWCGPASRQDEIEPLIEAAALMPCETHVAIIAMTAPPSATDFAERLTRHANAHGVAERVHFLAAPEPADLLPYLSGADLGVITRSAEHGTSFQTMVMARLPIAVADGGEIADFVRKHDLGEAFAGQTPKDIATVVERMLEPTTCARLRQNTMTVAEDMTWEAERTAYLAAIRALAPAAAIATPS